MDRAPFRDDRNRQTPRDHLSPMDDFFRGDEHPFVFFSHLGLFHLDVQSLSTGDSLFTQQSPRSDGYGNLLNLVRYDVEWYLVTTIVGAVSVTKIASHIYPH
jgi:hypothetical protein